MQAESIPRIRSAIEHAVVSALSDMAFLDAIPCSAGEVPVSHLIWIAFSGPESGELVLHLPHSCKRQIVENIYGGDWEDLTASEIDDCLLEVLNVIAGTYVRERNGPHANYDISLPQLLFDETPLAGREFEDYYFDAEGVLIRASLRIDAAQEE